MFVRARLEEGTNPTAAGSTAGCDPYAARRCALVVGADDKVEVRNITATQAIGDKWLVTEGLKDGDRVIVTGLQKVRPGVQVKRRK
jgi:membrane fusion protein (multidrug efflux system)